MLGKCFLSAGVILCYLAVIIAKKYVFVFRNIPVRHFNLYIKYTSILLGGLYGCDWLFKGLVALCHSFCVFLLFCYNAYNHLLIPFAEALHIFIAAGSVGGTSLWCRAEIRTRACLTASQRTTNWAAMHPTILSGAALTFTFRDIYVFWRFRFVYYTFCDAKRFVTLYIM